MLFAKRTNRLERVVVVEDEPLLAFDTEHALEDAGFHIVATLDSADEAIALIDGGTAIDLVLADVNLAQGSGIEVARIARARRIAVLFVTGNCPGEARALANGCLSKPYPQRDLIHAIAAIDEVIHGEQPKRVPASLSLFDPAT